MMSLLMQQRIVGRLGRRMLLNELKYFYLVDTFFIEYRLRQEKYCLILGAE